MNLLALLTQVVAPRSSSEDVARHEFILNVLLVGAIALLLVGLLVDFANKLFMDPGQYVQDSLPVVTFTLLIVLAVFLGLYALSRLAFVRTASYILLALFFSLAFYMSYTWGVNLPASILFYVLTIAMSGILLGTRSAFVTTLAVVAAIATTATLEQANYLAPNRSWSGEGWAASDVIVACTILLVITTISWLSNREIARSLHRARVSESALKEERDLLEVRVAERTAELRAAELERLSQAYRFVEFGKIASGLFHDLVNPLTALSLNIENIALTQQSDGAVALSLLAEDVAHAQSATTHMQQLMAALRQHLVQQKTAMEEFSLAAVIELLLQTMQTYAQSRDVTLRCAAHSEGVLSGDRTACIQVCSNLLSNAIESFPATPQIGVPREVSIEIYEAEGNVCLQVSDLGAGIAPEQLPHIFEPFYSTKAGSGLGLGLPLTKDLVEKQFGGEIQVTSERGAGTRFTVYFPIREP